MKDEVRNGIILGISVILIIVIVYLSTAIFMTGEIGNKTKKKTTTTTAQTESEYSNQIMASMILTRKEESYKVVIFSKKEASNELKDAIKNYSGDTKLYVVNLDEATNKIIKGDFDNLTVTNITELKVKENALLTITNNTITSSIIGGAKIISELK